MKKLRVLLPLIAAILVAGAAIAYASIPDTSGVIHGCRKTSNANKGALIVIDSEAGETCPKGYASLNWRSNGVHDIEYRSASVNLNGQNGVWVQALCSTSAHRVLGGGFDGGAGAPGVEVSASRPIQLGSSRNAGWEAAFTNPELTFGSVGVYAVCALPN
jgi:hypothetical protein